MKYKRWLWIPMLACLFLGACSSGKKQTPERETASGYDIISKQYDAGVLYEAVYTKLEQEASDYAGAFFDRESKDLVLLVKEGGDGSTKKIVEAVDLEQLRREDTEFACTDIGLLVRYQPVSLSLRELGTVKEACQSILQQKNIAVYGSETDLANNRVVLAVSEYSDHLSAELGDILEQRGWPAGAAVLEQGVLQETE